MPSNQAPQTRPPGPRVAKQDVHTSAPGLGWYTDTILYGEMWERPELSKRDRSLITVAALVTSAHMAQLNGHLNRALKNGVTPVEIVELITHLAFYAGWPCTMSSIVVMGQVFEANGVTAEQSAQSLGTAPEPAGSHAMSSLEEIEKRVLQEDLWKRIELAPRDRSLATIAAFLTQGLDEPLREQLELGRANGLTETEVVEAASHLAFYAGWGRSATALALVRAVYATGTSD